jgi:tetratricopeptide (TPR) repeat protein
LESTHQPSRELLTELTAMIQKIPENKDFEKEYEVKDIVVADAGTRAVQLVNTALDLSTKYDGLDKVTGSGSGEGGQAQGWHPFLLDWSTTGTEGEREHRKQIEAEFAQYASMAKKQFPNVRLLFAFHLAPSAEVCENILQGNFADLSSNDAGYFGQAIYLTTSVEYAIRFYGRGKEQLHLIFCAVVIGNSFPVLECPFVNGDRAQTAGLYGKPIRAKSDSHIVIVSSDPVANHGLSDPLPAPPEHWPHSRTYTEIAVGSASQILPLGYTVLKMKPAKQLAVEDTDAESMGGLGRFQQSQNNPARAMAYFDKAVELSPERSRHLHLAQRAKLHEENQDSDSAIADLEKAVALQPEWHEGLQQMGAAYEAAGYWVEALRTFQAVVDAKPEMLGEMFQRMSKVSQQLVVQMAELQQRKGSAVVKKNEFAAENASLKRTNERLAAEKQRWEQEKKEWEREKREMVAAKSAVDKRLEDTAEQLKAETQRWEREKQEWASLSAGSQVQASTPLALDTRCQPPTGQGLGGIMFDIEATGAGGGVSVDALWVAHHTTGSITTEIWVTRQGSHSTASADGSDWRRVFMDSGSHTQDTLRRCALEQAVDIEAGGTRGFYVCADDSSGISFTNKKDGGHTASDERMVIHRGCSMKTTRWESFGNTGEREYVGRVEYRAGQTEQRRKHLRGAFQVGQTVVFAKTSGDADWTAPRSRIAQLKLKANARPAWPDGMAFEVVGCGLTEFNGFYKEDGSESGKPRYRHASGSEHTLNYSGDTWYIAKGFSGSWYKMGCRTSVPPSDGWHTASNGKGSAPTLRFPGL